MTTELFPQIGGMLPQDYIPPEYKLIQRTSGVKGQPGQFWHSLKQEAVADIHALVLKLTETRTKWGRDEISSDPPECSSDDASSFKSRDGQDCLECEFRCDNPWDYGPEERRSKCLKGFVILGIDLDEGLPFVMRLSGISALPMREFATNLKFRALKGNLAPVKVTFRGESKATQYGESYFVQPAIEGTLTEEEVEALLPLAKELVALPAVPVLEQPKTKKELAEAMTKQLQETKPPEEAISEKLPRKPRTWT
ncbi:hypothetical protein ES703_58663 [subsurface metagenome]